MKWLAFGVQIVILALSWTTPCSESLLHGHIMCCIIICCSFNDTSMATLAIRTFIQILVWSGSPWQQGVIRSLDHARLVYRYTLLNWANQVNHQRRPNFHSRHTSGTAWNICHIVVRHYQFSEEKSHLALFQNLFHYLIIINSNANESEQIHKL